ncbi:MAG: hypothetical protein IPN04_11740 [Rhodoferax sp.]|nr:hypothetical protein [Rhodoferax sp.]
MGGAHRDLGNKLTAFLKRALNDAYRQVSDLKVKELLDKRYERLQSYRKFIDIKAEAKSKTVNTRAFLIGTLTLCGTASTAHPVH